MGNAAILRIGPAGWSYPDWKGKVYPVKRPRGFEEAAYLAEFFDTLEINTTFYSPPRRDLARSWARQVERNRNFKFTAKVYRRFTHERDAGPGDERAYKEGVAPLAEGGRLGALLLQFPWSFRYTPENREYLLALVGRFREYPLVVEVRHSSWNQPEVLEMLAEMNVGLCNVDQPVIGRSMAPSEYVTASLGYVRLHGRNYQQWFGDHPVAERYNYLYSRGELEPWAARIRKMLEAAGSVYVIANNHFEAKSVVNALQLRALVTGTRVRVPKLLVANYPELKEVAVDEATDSSGGQRELWPLPERARGGS